MTDEELIAMARLAQRDERMSTGALYGDLADRIEALIEERDALLSALGRIRPVPERILRGVPVRDLAETLAEADSALSKGDKP